MPPRYSSGGRAAQPHAQPLPYVLGLVLLHPNLSGVMGPAFSRVLARSTLGRSILRPLLRTEVGEIANRRAWHNTDKLTSEVRAPLRDSGRAAGCHCGLLDEVPFTMKRALTVKHFDHKKWLHVGSVPLRECSLVLVLLCE